MVRFNTMEKIARRELAQGMKRMWTENKAQETGDDNWWKRVLDLCIIGTGGRFRSRKEEIHFAMGMKTTAGRTAQIGQLKERNGRKTYYDDFRSLWMLKQLIDSKLSRDGTDWWLLDLPLPILYSVIFTHTKNNHRDISFFLVLLWELNFKLTVSMTQVGFTVSPAWETLRTAAATIHTGGLASRAGLKAEKYQICKLSLNLVV